MLWPALLAEPLDSIAAQMAATLEPATEANSSEPVVPRESEAQVHKAVGEVDAKTFAYTDMFDPRGESEPG